MTLLTVDLQLSKSDFSILSFHSYENKFLFVSTQFVGIYYSSHTVLFVFCCYTRKKCI